MNQGHAIYLDDGSPVPHPGRGWTRFVCISDTHSLEYVVPPGDVLLHAGDLSSWGHPSQLTRTIEWLKSLEHPIKIIVAGNHDLCLDRDWATYGLDAEAIEQVRAYVRNQSAFGLHYLEHALLDVPTSSGKVWKVYGSPAAPVHVEGAFQYATQAEAKGMIYDKIPDDTEILITHTPPYGILDMTRKGKYVGCPVLLSRLGALNHCRLHVFGHIHEAAGTYIEKADTETPRVSVNAAMPGSEKAIIVDLRN